MTDPAPPPETVVVIDDDDAIRLACEQALTRVGYRVETHADGAAGLQGVATATPGLVVVDLKLPGLSGLDVIARLHDLDPTITIVVITGYATIGTAVEAMKAGAYDFLPKPFTPDELRLIVRRGLERRRLQLIARQCELERELQRRRFVTFVSHQLKTPLVAIHQYLDVLQRLRDDPATAAKRTEWIERCLTRTDELRKVVDDWLTLARIEGGTLGRQRTLVDLKQVVPAVVVAYEAMAAERSVTMEYTLPAADYQVQGDPTCISVLVDNLLANAIAYNRPGGRVHVRASHEAGEVVLEVADTGVGIPAADLPFLYDEFFRGRRTGAAECAGTGLGLPICRRIVNELGGAIEVESTEGVGSTFRVRLPAAGAASHAP